MLVWASFCRHWPDCEQCKLPLRVRIKLKLQSIVVSVYSAGITLGTCQMSCEGAWWAFQCHWQMPPPSFSWYRYAAMWNLFWVHECKAFTQCWDRFFRLQGSAHHRRVANSTILSLASYGLLGAGGCVHMLRRWRKHTRLNARSL
jgi:hypothetical protein